MALRSASTSSGASALAVIRGAASRLRFRATPSCTASSSVGAAPPPAVRSASMVSMHAARVDDASNSSASPAHEFRKEFRQLQTKSRGDKETKKQRRRGDES